MKFKICDWEDNGYHDSYFVGLLFDDESETLEAVEYAATAYGGCNPVWTEAAECTAEIAERARRILAGRIFEIIKAAELRDVFEPYAGIKAGTELVLTKSHNFYLKKTEPCRKCNGSGKWTNPRNENDKRPCFACKGAGSHGRGFVTDEKGKRVRQTLEAGTELVPFEKPTAFGTFYRNGYNKPNRAQSLAVANI